MLVKKVVLENIRSYESCEVNFREGVTLLSGDIGSGKSTILLALEFALFGIIKGSLSGGSLLRRGESQGSVILELTLDKKNILIKRSLKKTSTGIGQDAGFIEINGVREDLTPVELKNKVLELLGYPSSLLGKSKDLIYRYTVYTPQEEMKTILFEDSESRLNKLRKLFDLDKYVTVRENALEYTREIKRKIDLLNVKVEAKAELKQKKDFILKEEEQVLKKIKEEEQVLKEKQSILKKLQEKQEFYEKQKQEVLNHKNKVESLKYKFKVLEDSYKSYQDQINELEKELKQELKEVLFEDKTSTINNNLNEKKEYQEKLRDAMQEVLTKKSLLQEKIKESESKIKDIDELDVCICCGQRVEQSHKLKVKKQEEELVTKRRAKLSLVEDKLSKIKDKSKEIVILIENLEKERQSNLEKKQEYHIYLERKKEQVRKKDLIEKRKEDIKNQKEELVVLNQSISNLENKKFEYNLEAHEKIRKELAEIQQEINSKERVYGSLCERRDNNKKLLEEIKLKLEEITKNEKKIEKYKLILNWFSSHFVNLTQTIETHMLATIHKEFNEFYKDWFNLLLEDETVSSELDETFSPIVKQNGYDAEVETLSGGEKTTTALAFRLALNKVINDYIDTIHTKDIIILDEPTDGFSSDQLDKIRDVLESLNFKQVIIVSHEAKLESMSEHIIRVVKTNHKSEILF